MRFTLTTLAFLAYTHCTIATTPAGTCEQQPGPNNIGLAIHAPPDHFTVPAGTPYTVSWTNDTGTSVSIVLYQGPSTNLLPIGCLANGIANVGTFVWTPGMDLAPSGNVGYGLRIIADNGNWQWSNAFGVSNPGYTGGSVAPTAYEAPKTTSASVTPLSEASDGQVLAPTAKVTSLPITNSAASSAIAYYTSTSTASASSSASVSQQVSNITSPTSIYYSATLPHYHHNNNNTTRASYAQSNASGKLPVVLSIGIVASSGSSVSESVKPTGTMSVPSTLSPISRTSVAAGGTATSLTATGAAGRAVVGGVVAGLGAVAALVL